MKKIISLILCAVLVFTAATVLIVNQTVKLKTNKIDAVPTAMDYSSKTLFDTPTTEFENGYRAVIENEKFVLGYNLGDASVALLNKTTGYIWYSNPIGEEATQKSKAQLEFYYYNNNSITSIDSYEHGIKIDSIPKYEVEGNTLSVNYKIGNNKFKLEMLPTVVKRDRFEKEFLSKLSDEEKEEVLAQYTLFSREELDKDTYDIMIISFPSLAKSDLYVRPNNIPSYVAEKAYNYLVKAGYTMEDLQFDCDDNGVENTFVQEPYFNVQLKYHLTDDGFAVTLDPKSMEYNENYMPIKVSVLPFFGATSNQNTGFILLPDGSGAVIELNNGKISENGYNKSFFTADGVLNTVNGEVESQLSLLPYFGLSSENGGFIASVDSGYEVGGVNAQISRTNNPYNTVSSFFTLFISSKVAYSGTSGDSFNRFCENIFSDNISISYHFADTTPTYSQLAVIYREHLKKNGMLNKSDIADSAMNITFKGVAKLTKNFLGMNYEAYDPYTTTDEATQIIKTLDIKNINVRLDNFLEGGEIQKSISSLKFENSSGDLEDIKELYGLTGNTFVSVNAQHIAKNGKDYASIAISQEPAYGLEFDTATRKKELFRYSVIVSPKYLNSAVKKLVKQVEKNKIEAINIEDIAFSINSDARERNEVGRFETRVASQNFIKTLSKEALISVNKGSIYSLGYADKVWDIPMDSSNYLIEDYSVPFYQIVLSGSIPYTTPEINNASDTKSQFLKAVEYGAEPQFTLVYKNLDDVDYYKDDYYGYYYENHIETIKNYADSYAKVCEKTSGASIVNHKIENGVSVTEYDNGVKIYVNYNETDIIVDSNTVNSQDFLIVG